MHICLKQELPPFGNVVFAQMALCPHQICNLLLNSFICRFIIGERAFYSDEVENPFGGYVGMLLTELNNFDIGEVIPEFERIVRTLSSARGILRQRRRPAFHECVQR